MAVRSNKPPTVQERRVLKLIATKEKEIANTLEEQIAETSTAVEKAQANFSKAQHRLSDLRELLDVLNMQHDRLLQSLEEKKKLCHPLRGFPKEILAEIFSFCVGKDTRTAKSKPAELVLSQVCRDWRTVLHSTPSLWENIDVDFERNSNPIPKTTHWIERSGNAPLHVSVKGVSSASDANFNGIMDILVRVASRWDSFSATTSCGSIATSLLSKLTVPTPRLTTLRLRRTCCTIGLPLRFLPDSPILRTVDIEGLYWEHIPLGYPKLQSIRFVCSCAASQDYLDHISRFPALKDLDLAISWHQIQKTPSPSSFLNVSSLVLNSNASQFFANEETPLAFPNLKTLKLDSLRSTHELRLLFCFLKNLPHPERLDCLILSNCDDGEGGSTRLEEFQQGLSRTTGIKTLRLEYCGFDDNLLGLFTSPSSNPSGWLCNDLQHLAFKQCNQITCDSILRLIEARGNVHHEDTSNQPRAITSVDVNDCSRIEAQHCRRIKEKLGHHRVQ